MTRSKSLNPDLARYHRQMLLPGIGREGQERLRHSHALVVGCGALGTFIADGLARAGVGTLSIVDRDVVEITNLQRQILFDERDVAEGAPKAEAARRKIAQINSQVTVRAIVDDFNFTNAEAISREADVILDGLDNFQTRYLLNDVSVKHGIPYVYGGAVGTTGMACTFLPRPGSDSEARSEVRSDEGRDHWRTVTWSEDQATPCLRCIFPEAPPPGSTPTCDTAGVLASAVAMIAHHQVAQAVKLLTGNLDALDRSLLSIDVWRNETRRLDISSAQPDCPCCKGRRFEYLDGAAGSSVTSLCGRGSVQINPRVDQAASRDGREMNLTELANRLAPHGTFTSNRFLLRGRLTGEEGAEGTPIEITVFADGRAIISGTDSPVRARTVYDKYIGG